MYLSIDIDECVDPKSCSRSDSEACVNTVGSFVCQCKPGYMRNYDESNCEGTYGVVANHNYCSK